MQALLYADITNRVLTQTLGGNQASLPKLVQGDDITIGFRFSATHDGSASEIPKTLTSLKATVGFVDARPTSGSFVIRIGAGPYVTGTNQTSNLSYDVEASTIVSSLVSLGLSSAAAVKIDGSWIISNGGAAIIIDAVSAPGTAALVPSSFARVRSTVTNGFNKYELRLIQSPLASTSAFSLIVPPAPEITRAQAGGTSSAIVWPEIQSLKISPNFRGTYQIRRGYKKTVELSVDDGPDQISDALIPLADEGGTFLVSNPSSNIAHITFLGSMSGIAQDLLTIAVFAAPPGDPTFTISLDTAEVADSLRANEEATPTLEIEMVVADDSDPSIHHVITPCKMPITLVREINYNGLEVAAGIDWLRPPNGQTYVPFTSSQIITGAQNYVAPIGNGSATSITLTHNLGTRDCHVTVRKNSGDLAKINPDSIKYDTINTLTMTFATAPTTNQYVAVVSTAGPVSAFQAHTHTIAQIVGLQAIIDDLGGRIVNLETIVALPGAAGSNVVGKGFDIKIPEISIIVPPATNVATRQPLLPSVYDASVASVTPPLSGVLSQAGQVQQINANWTIPASRNRRAWPVATSGYVASNGEVFYEVRKSGNSFFPVEFEQDLAMLWVSSAMFPAKRDFNLSLIPTIQLLGNCRAEYIIEVSFGTITQDTGTGVALNLAGITWATPIISERLLLSSAIVTHPIDVTVSSDYAGTLTATSSIYGRTLTATPPSTNAFALRVRLLNFDPENIKSPKGIIAIKMPSASAKITPK